MQLGRPRRTAALALTASAAIGACLATAAPAGAVSQVGGNYCHTNGVTVYYGYGNTSAGCFAGTAGSVDTSLAATGSVSSVVNHGYAQYVTSYPYRDDVTGFLADSLHYLYDDPKSSTYSVTIMN